MARYGSPVCDLSHFLFACTDQSLREKHFDYAIRLYYYTLCARLSELGSDPEKLFPFTALQDELKRFSVVGLYSAVIALFGMYKTQDEILDVNNENMKLEDLAKMVNPRMENQVLYERRTRDVIVDFCSRGYFDFLG